VGALLPPPITPYAAAIDELDETTFARMHGRSWKEEARCPPRAALARVTVRHLRLDGAVATGELVVARAIAVETAALFGRLYAIGFPLARIELVDAHDADDDRSMAADNTSAFNYRLIAGTTVLSQHALGLAIDLNPVENPMIWPGGARFVPPAGAAFLDRGVVRPGMIVRPGPVTAIFDELGWEWGGDWRHVADLHHIAWPRR